MKSDDSKSPAVDSSLQPASTMTQEEYDSLFDAVIKNNSQDSNDVTGVKVAEDIENELKEEKLAPEQAPPLPEAVNGNFLEAIVNIKQVR
jgi:hypothetical protein